MGMPIDNNEPLLALEKIKKILKDYPKLYERAVAQAEHADKLAAGFMALQNVGATLKWNLSLYSRVIAQAEYADKLADRFTALHVVGVMLEDYPFFYLIAAEYEGADYLNELIVVLTVLKSAPSLYKRAIEKAEYAVKLASVFKMLEAAGATLQSHPLLFERVIEHTAYADEIAASFKVLEEVGATLKDHPLLYKKVIENPKLTAAVFGVLRAAGATPQSHPLLYEIAIERADYADNLAVAFKALERERITLQSHPLLYEITTEKAEYADKLPETMVALKAMDLFVEEEVYVYELAFQQLDNNITHVCRQLKLFGFKSPDDNEILKNIFTSYGHHVFYLLEWLNRIGFKKVLHGYIFEAFFKGDSALIHSPYNTTRVQHCLQLYFQPGPLLGRMNYAEQRTKVESLINTTLETENEITQGPLNKADETLMLETVLKRLIKEGIAAAHLRFDSDSGYMLQFGDEPELYLSELLNRVNFEHLALSNDEVNALGNLIYLVDTSFNKKQLTDSNLIVEKLPDAAQRALFCYIRRNKYKNINRLFRAVPQTSESNYTWIKPVEGHENLLVNFLAGCLINWSAAELPRLLHQSEEHHILERVILSQFPSVNDGKQHLKRNDNEYAELLKIKLNEGIIQQDEYEKVLALFDQLDILFPHYGLVNRGELLTDAEVEHESATQKRRLANPQHHASVLSFSIFQKGIAFFHKEGTTRTQMQTSIRPIINASEGEILIPAGTTFSYTQGSQDCFFAREINSPGFIPGGDYWSSIALAEAFRNHLSKPYKDSSDYVTVAGVRIERPNHGLAHVYRGMLYVDVVIDYFAHHAKDHGFKLFCQNLQPTERAWLRVAAAYRSAGRESEIAAQENFERYTRYRQSSEAYMAAFLEKYPPSSQDEAMRDRMLNIVRWMGNPAYEQPFDGRASINTHPNSEERSVRTFFHRILTISHQLDLPRCYTFKQMNRVMEWCRSLSKDSLEQEVAYSRMVKYAIDLMRAHGSSLMAQLALNGEWEGYDQPYCSPFQKVSSSLRELYEFTDTVPRPPLNEAYQYSLIPESHKIHIMPV